MDDWNATGSFQNWAFRPIFRGELLVSGRVDIFFEWISAFGSSFLLKSLHWSVQSDDFWNNWHLLTSEKVTSASNNIAIFGICLEFWGGDMNWFGIKRNAGLWKSTFIGRIVLLFTTSVWSWNSSWSQQCQKSWIFHSCQHKLMSSHSQCPKIVSKTFLKL